jgi:predicted RNA binding protein YcfA (HicA-like mRNA interferase family)
MMTSREVGCPRLVNALCVLGYEATRQNGSHVRVTTLRDDVNHEVIPNDRVMKAGTVHSILRHVAAHHRMSMGDLLKVLSL